MPNKEVSHRRNKITVKCYGSKHAAKTNCAVQMKHVIGQLEEIAVGAEVTMSLIPNATVPR